MCAALPLPSASVDAVVCDLPFGRKFGSKTDMAANLPVILAEMERLVPFLSSFIIILALYLIIFWFFCFFFEDPLLRRDSGPSPESSVVVSSEKTAAAKGHWDVDQ